MALGLAVMTCAARPFSAQSEAASAAAKRDQGPDLRPAGRKEALATSGACALRRYVEQIQNLRYHENSLRIHYEFMRYLL